MNEIKLKGLNETIYEDTCENGLKIYMWVNKKVNTFYGTLSVKYGSIHNNFRIKGKNYSVPAGVAHFLEHVKFNENEEETAHDFFYKMGSDTNAFTTFHYTNYQVFGSDNAKENINHLLDFVNNDFFSKKIVNNEKGIITEEAKMGEDDPYTLMLFKHLDNLFNKGEHKKLITGTPQDIKKITLEDILLVYKTFYHPKNMFLVVTGNFNPYEIAEAVKENQRNKKFDKFLNPKRIIEKESKKVRVEYEELNINVTNKKIKIGIKMPKKDFKNFDDLHIRLFMGMILKANFGNTSDFKDELLQKEIINSMSYMTEIFDDYVLVMFTIDSDYKDEIIKLMNEKLASMEINEKTFNRIKKGNIATIILEYEDVEMVNNIIQTEILNYGKIVDDIKEIYESIEYSEVEEFINCIDISNKSILILNPLNNK